MLKNSAYEISQDLSEVIDNNNLPVCIMPISEIITQNLRHWEVAIILEDENNRLLLSYINQEISFLALRPLPALKSFEELAYELYQKICDLVIPCPRLIGKFYMLEENFITVNFISKISSKLALYLGSQYDFLLASRNELTSLLDKGYIFNPVFKKFLEKYF